jgi:hypothetical protein
MADDQKDPETGDAPWGEGPDVPPLSDAKNPLAGDEAGTSDEDEAREWTPPVP